MRLGRHASLFEPQPADLLARRDPDFIRAEMGLLGGFTDAWYAPELQGLENVPDGRALVVGTHNGGNQAPDMFCTMVAFWRHFGVERPAYGLAHDQVMAFPLVGRWLYKLGAVPAHQRNARGLLERDATVLVYPGGDIDAFKPYRERHVVKFGRRAGFIRTALATGAPIVPVVSVGAHESVYIVTDGRELAERLQLKKLLRIEVMPIMLAPPFGLWVGPLDAHWPVPSKVRIRVLPPLRFSEPPSAAEDPVVVEALKERVRAAMQSAVDELAAEGGYGPRARLAELLG
jgi:1-acyl-sn-glycerol-3-phosphate acyltransferase